MAIVQVSVFDTVNAITGRYPAFRAPVTAPSGASVDAAVLAATRTALSKLVPAQQAAIDADYNAALKSVPDGPAKTDGIAVGEQVATKVPAGPTAELDQRHLEARPRRNQGDRRQGERQAHTGADGHRQVLGSDGARRLLAGGALGRERARPRRWR